MKRLQRLSWLFLLLVLNAPIATAKEGITLGVFAYRPADVMLMQYQPLADYLSEKTGLDVRLEVLAQDDMNRALAANQLDLFLTNPSHFLVIRSERSVTGVLATVLSQSGATSTASLGGVIIARRQRDDINRLEDLDGRIIASPGVHFLGGYQSQLLELIGVGVDPRRRGRIKLLGSHDRVVRSVLAGDVDAGFIRTGILEQMSADNPRLRDQLKVLNAQNLSGFPYEVSTRLYPEWPLVALPHVDQARVRRIASALFALGAEDPAARAAGIAGFAPPADYQSVELLARELRVAPYDHAPQLTWLDAFHQYRFWVVAVGLLLALLLASSVWLGRKKRQVATEQRRLRRLILSWPQPMLMIRDGRFFDFNRAALELLRCPSHEFVMDKAVASFMPLLQPGGESSAAKVDEVMARVGAGLVESGEWIFERADGSQLCADMTLAPIHEGGEQDNVILCALYDVTRRKQAEQRQRLAASVFEHAREAIFITDEHGMVIDVNGAYSSMIGYSRARATGRLPPLPMEEGPGILHTARERGFWAGEFVSKRADGKNLTLALTVSRVLDERETLTHFVGIFSDISRLKEQENKLRTMAHYDALTQLPNRSLFADRLQQTMAQARRQGDHLAVVYIDLDHFKPVNDAFGHGAGDELLVEVASRMRAMLREEDTLARLGGDEFAAIIVNVQDRTSLEKLLKRLLLEIAEPVWVADHMVEVSGSVGVTLYPQAAELDGDQLLRQADQAMYRAKQAGRNGYCLFDAGDTGA
ncbi:diguanylate cyclase domain-containing protein [Marinobacter goseongensis]|uniref:diguanylate cyclase domain-containing protein n=1 Tax=Marinobacter goseongensis TaxID=453838 RepID=UPI0020068D65|nr:diguanylate cyclase [Marinobacter goseongensis]